jgi:hypothetical protein
VHQRGDALLVREVWVGVGVQQQPRRLEPPVRRRLAQGRALVDEVFPRQLDGHQRVRRRRGAGSSMQQRMHRFTVSRFPGGFTGSRGGSAQQPQHRRRVAGPSGHLELRRRAPVEGRGHRRTLGLPPVRRGRRARGPPLPHRPQPLDYRHVVGAPHDLPGGRAVAALHGLVQHGLVQLLRDRAPVRGEVLQGRHHPQPLHHRRVAFTLRHLPPRPAELALDLDVAARPREQLHAFGVVVDAGVVEGRGAAAGGAVRRDADFVVAGGVYGRPTRQQQPHHLQLAAPRRDHQRGAAVAGTEVGAGAGVQQQPRRLQVAGARRHTERAAEDLVPRRGLSGDHQGVWVGPRRQQSNLGATAGLKSNSSPLYS